MAYDLIFGIDPGVSTGFAIWDKGQKKLIQVSTLQHHQAAEKILEHKGKRIFVRFEDSNLRKWIPKERDIKQVMGRAKGAGSVGRDCSLWQEFLTMHNIPFEAVAPKNNKTKLPADTFAKITGWTGRCSEHARDAAMLIFGL